MACIAFLDGQMEGLQELYAQWNGSHYDRIPDVVVYRNRHPLLAYAEHSWGHHVAMCQRNGAVCQYATAFLLKHALRSFSHIINDYLGSSFLIVTGLHIAAFYGLVEIISSRVLPCLSAPRALGFTPFHFAAMSGNVDAFTALTLTYGAIEPGSAHGRTPLHTAVEHKQVLFVQQILARRDLGSPNFEVSLKAAGIDVNARDKSGFTPLIMACHPTYNLSHGSKSVGMLEALIAAKGLDVNLRDNENLTAFFHACSNEEIADTLISALPGLEIDTRGENGVTAFMKACDHGFTRAVTWMLTCSIHGGMHLLHECDHAMHTALMRLCAHLHSLGQAHIRAILELLLRDADMDLLHAQDFRGNTAFLLAARCGNNLWDREEFSCIRLHLLERLLEREPALLEQRNQFGETALILAASQNQRLSTSPQTTLFILSRYDLIGASHYVNAQDEWGQSALIAALASSGRGPRSTEVVAALLSHPLIDIHIRDGSGRDALTNLFNAPRRDKHDSQDSIDVDQCAKLLLNHAHFEASAARKSILKYFNPVGDDPEGCSYLQVEYASLLLKLEINGDSPSHIFRWTIEDPETLLLLVGALALGRKCKIFAGVILHCLGLLPSPQFHKPGWGYCEDVEWDSDDQSTATSDGGYEAHGDIHCHFYHCKIPWDN